jgi:alkylation response protein AidB-like acyl-CoA dehydrogenase
MIQIEDELLVPQSADVVAAAEELAPVISERALEAEELRRVPDDIIATMRRTGLLNLFLPRVLGGCEVDPLTGVDVVSTIARADGSAGFTLLTLNATFFLAWLDHDIARQVMLDEPGGGMATVFAPLGRAVPLPSGALKVNGRWPFNTGSRNAAWFANGVMVLDGDRPAIVPPGRPDWRLVFFPKSDASVLDTWHTAGLRATGSNDVEVTDITVPAAFTANPIFERAKHDGPLFRWSFFSLMGVLFAGFPLGVARRALDEFETMALTKSRGSRRLAEDESVEIAVARAEASLRAARAYVDDVIGSLWEKSLQGETITVSGRAAVRLAAGHAMRTGVSIVDTVFRLGGGAALYDRCPIQRCWRDAHACSHHGYFSEYHETRVGRALLDVPIPDVWMM